MKKYLFLIFLIILNFGFYGSSETLAQVDVTLNPMGDFKAKTKDISGEAFLKKDEVYAENVTVKLESLSSGIALRDKHMKEKYLQIAQFPEAKLIKAIGKNGKGSAKIKIRDQEKIVKGTYKIENKELVASFNLNLRDFGIQDVSYKNIGVEDEVKITVILPLREKNLSK